MEVPTTIDKVAVHQTPVPVIGIYLKKRTLGLQSRGLTSPVRL
jgi:hypothetical protein